MFVFLNTIVIPEGVWTYEFAGYVLDLLQDEDYHPDEVSKDVEEAVVNLVGQHKVKDKGYDYFVKRFCGQELAELAKLTLERYLEARKVEVTNALVTCYPSEGCTAVAVVYTKGEMKEMSYDKVVRPFKVGDEVFMATQGYGIVTEVREDNEDTWYPVIASFNGEEVSFTPDGRLFINTSARQLFHRYPVPEKSDWRANKGETYLSISTLGTIECHTELEDVNDDRRYEAGNYFKDVKTSLNSRYYKAYHEKLWYTEEDLLEKARVWYVSQCKECDPGIDVEDCVMCEVRRDYEKFTEVLRQVLEEVGEHND